MGRIKHSRKKCTIKKEPVGTDRVICVNRDCRLRVKGCKGFEGCPGYKGRG